ncbi:putative mrna binding protein pumilio 2 [Diplodia seriata]|uniref:Putative mrna binding protein pumilio 2 n=1 Tax=Diplodia seriata TaxID=420778 RepID=A0A0G2H872_9PEZI|nr:putative mrna binding protein pumilio 2 [Diplodia seriata]
MSTSAMDNGLGPVQASPSESDSTVTAATTSDQNANPQIFQLEKKKAEYEYLKEQRRRFEAEMELYDIQIKGVQNDFNRLSQDVVPPNNYTGHQSEPTTPPEYRDQGFPSAFSRPQRYSMQSLTSPQQSYHSGSTRPSRSGSQITSPGQNFPQGISHIPSKSMPGSRRGSDEEEDNYEFDVSNMNPRSGATALNRNSVPVTGLDFRHRANAELPDLPSVLGHIDTTHFLFGDDDEKPRNPAASPDVKSYLQMNTKDGKFPILVRHGGGDSMQLSASSAALDLASVSSHSPDPQSNGWPTTSRHRHAQHSLPANNLHKSDEFGLDGSGANGTETPRRSTISNRHSMEVRFSPYSDSKRPGPLATPPHAPTNGMPKLQSSYSTNDIPTMKNANGLNGTPSGGNGVNSHAEQHLHHHNASMGRIPMNAVNRHSRELSGGENRIDDPAGAAAFRSMGSALQANAAPFGPALSNGTNGVTANGTTTAAGVSSATATAIPSSNGAGITSPPVYGNPNTPYYGGYGMAMLNVGMQNLNPNGQAPYNQMQMYSPFNPYSQPFQQPFTQQAPAQPRFPDSQARVIQQRRMQNQEEHMRSTTNYNFDSLMPHDIVELCKDQHGCRYLQKQIEGRNLDIVKKIFEATKDHVVDLMQDPFANYLCQKMYEFCNDEQRTALVRNAAPQMVKIALNQHGTRALQKMIEYVSTTEQINIIIEALRHNVVTLIQDLNGNHVIQKCLNHLGSKDSQFIFEAVGRSCVVVGTHRHGCCVLQRCIDHASGDQRIELIGSITSNAFSLVQDPFGNYVVQYILDLQEEQFTVPLCHSFGRSVPMLSKQKFSSNVIEKCIRVSPAEAKRALIEELLIPGELEKLIRDSYANYVVQTALDYADAPTKIRLVEAIRPMLNAIRATPYGRRIMSKIQDFDGRMSTNSSGQITPTAAVAPGQIAFPGQLNVTPQQGAYSNMTNGYGTNLASPQPHRLSNPQVPHNLQNNVQQNMNPYTSPFRGSNQLSDPFRGPSQQNDSSPFRGPPQQNDGSPFRGSNQQNGGFF